MAHHLGTESVVTEEDIADAGYQNRRRDRTCTCVASPGSAGRGESTGTPFQHSGDHDYRDRRQRLIQPTTSISNSSHLLQWLDFVRCEVQIAAVPLVQVGSGVVVDDDTDVSLALDVLVDRGHPRDPVGEEEILGVGTAEGCSRTRLPRLTRTPLISTASTEGSDSVACHWVPPAGAVGNLWDQAG